MVHNAYTSGDEKHLVAYLALRNPEVKGRNGNKIYQELINNPYKWPWGKHHPWQSWRDHYVKKQSIMNKKIRIYQRKHGITAGPKDSENEGNKRKAMAKEEEEQSSSGEEKLFYKKRLREASSDSFTSMKKRRRTTEGSSDLYNDIKGKALAVNTTKEVKHGATSRSPLGEKSELSPEGAWLGTQVQATHDTEECEEIGQMLVGGQDTEDTLQLDTKPSHQMGPSIARPLSLIARKVPSSSWTNDSPDSLFDADSDILVPDSEEEQRVTASGSMRRRSQQQDDFFQSEPEDADTQGATDIYHPVKVKRRPPSLKEGPFGITFFGAITKAGRKIEDEDSDSVTSPSFWPPVRKKFPTSDSPRIKYSRKVKTGPYKNAITEGDETAPDYTDSSQYEVNHQQRAAQFHDPLPPTSQHSSHPSPRNQHFKRKRSSVLHSNGKGDTPYTPLEREHDGYPSDGKNVGVAEVLTQADVQLPDHGRRVDLLEERKEFLRRHTDASSSSRSTSASASYSSSRRRRQSPLSLQLSTQDQSLVTSLGIQQAITMMSKNHGFTEDVVSKILQTVNSIPRADEVLRHMRMKAEEEAEKQLISDPPQAQCSPPRQKQRRPTEAPQKLEIHATSDDERLSDYSPPPKTRAGQFTRLVEQGRHVEAYAREARRASGVVSPLKQASNDSNTTDKSESPLQGSANKLWKPQPKAVKDGIFLESDLQQGDGEDIIELRDAHEAMAGVFKKTEVSLGPRRALRQFQQTAAILSQLLADHQL